jgi:hypothetical protein
MGRTRTSPPLEAEGQARAASMAAEACRLAGRAARGCPERREDLECEAARVLVAAAGAYDPGRIGLPWPHYCQLALYRGLRRKRAELWARDRRMPTRPLGDDDADASPARDTRAAEQVADLIDSADLVDAELLRMKLEGLGYSEIGAALGLTREGARKRFATLAKKLRRERDATTTTTIQRRRGPARASVTRPGPPSPIAT